MRLPISDQVVDEDNGNEEDSDLETVEVERHRAGTQAFADTEPAQENHEWQDEECDLQRGADGDTDGEVEFVFDGAGRC